MGLVPQAYYDFIMDYAPYIYVIPPSTPDEDMGKGAFAASFAIDFLYQAYYSLQFLEKTDEILAKVVELADWLLTQQCVDNEKEAYGGFKSTESSTYYYSIDACRAIPSLLRAYALTSDTDYLDGAKLAGLTFLKAMQDKQADGGFAKCVTIDGAWLLEMEVECLYGLIGLKMLADTYDTANEATYESMMSTAVTFLRTGFDGKYLYYDPDDDSWHRTGLTENQIYDDPIAYAMLGLYTYEGWSNSVSTLYGYINGVDGGEMYPSYDPKICWAGYIDVVSEVVACDYYDAVTAGILSDIRLAQDTETFKDSMALIKTKLDNFMFWGVHFTDYTAEENKKAMATVCWLSMAFFDYNVPKWQITYYNTTSGYWEPVSNAAVDEIIEELDGHEEASFLLPNTSANRTFAGSDRTVRIYFEGTQLFRGTLRGVDYSAKTLKCYVYNTVYELLKRRIVSGVYENAAANVVAEAVRVAGGIAALGSCPTTQIDVTFDQTLCYDAMVKIAEATSKNLWVIQGTTLYIGTRGSAQSFDATLANFSTRGIDRAKNRNKVYVRGFNSKGEQLVGSAGAGTNVAVFWSHVATTAATLDLIAAKKLADLNSDDSSVSLTCPVTEAYHLHPGDSITLNKSSFALSGSYQVKKITKRRKTAEVEISRKKKIDETLEELLKDQGDSFSFTNNSVGVMENLSIKPCLIMGTEIKSSNDLVTTYIKESCVLPGGILLAAPTGNMNSYEGGYAALALIEKNGAGDRTVAKEILDEFAGIQNADGSWYQQYAPYHNGSGGHDHVEETSNGISGDLKVDSGAAMLAWAMSRYDEVTSGTIYKTYVQKALQFIRDLQYAHLTAHGSNLIANLILDGETDTYAFLADSAECLMACHAALDAYGAPLLTSGSYDVETLANNLYYSMTTVGWAGEITDYYHTTYPIDGQVLVPFVFKEKLAYTQAMCAKANYEWVNSGYLTVADESHQCEDCLDFILPLTSGQWGGQFYAPYYGEVDETQEEFAGYTALMLWACSVVDSTKYADDITRMTAFLKWLALSDGRMYDCADEDGRLWRAKVSGSTGLEEAYGFLVLPVAQALLSGV